MITLFKGDRLWKLNFIQQSKPNKQGIHLNQLSVGVAVQSAKQLMILQTMTTSVLFAVNGMKTTKTLIFIKG